MTTIRQRPVPGARDLDGLASRVIVASGDDYEKAVAALEGQVEQGWMMLGIQRVDEY